MYAANSVSFRINDKHLVHEASLSVEPGTITAILGANGAGKSTLIKMLSGDLKPSSGEVTLNEQPIHSYCPRTLARKRAVLPQHSSLQFAFRVHDVVEMGRAPYLNRTSPQRNSDIVHEALGLVDCLHLKNRDYTSLSGGEQQRVHLARVLAQLWEADDFPERYLLLDEPTSSLDIHHQYQLMKTLLDSTQRGIGIVLVVHDLNLAAQFADRVVVMKHGEIIAEGTPADALVPETIEEAFFMKTEVMYRNGSTRPHVVPIVEMEANVFSR